MCIRDRPYLDRGIFSELKAPRIFNAVRPFLGSVQWPNGQDFCPDTLYLQGTPIENDTPLKAQVAP